MALWSLFIEVDSKHYSTQVNAASPKAAISTFLRGKSLRSFMSGSEFDGWPKSFTSKDIVLFVPMEGLVNMHLCQLGRKGRYLSITLARTVVRA